jgi:hypothetical protein
VEHTEQLVPKKFKVDTPIGSLESDSGNHMIDVVSIIGVIAVLYIGKKILDRCIENFKL